MQEYSHYYRKRYFCQLS